MGEREGKKKKENEEETKKRESLESGIRCSESLTENQHRCGKTRGCILSG